MSKFKRDNRDRHPLQDWVLMTRWDRLDTHVLLSSSGLLLTCWIWYSEGLKSHHSFCGSIIPMRGSRCDPFASWSHQLCQIACGKPVFLMVLEQETFEIFLDLCCKTYVFTIVEVQEEGFWLDFVAADQVSTPCRHAEWNSKPPECDPGI